MKKTLAFIGAAAAAFLCAGAAHADGGGYVGLSYSDSPESDPRAWTVDGDYLKLGCRFDGGVSRRVVQWPASDEGPLVCQRLSIRGNVPAHGIYFTMIVIWAARGLAERIGLAERSLGGQAIAFERCATEKPVEGRIPRSRRTKLFSSFQTSKPPHQRPGSDILVSRVKSPSTSRSSRGASVLPPHKS